MAARGFLTVRGALDTGLRGATDCLGALVAGSGVTATSGVIVGAGDGAGDGAACGGVAGAGAGSVAVSGSAVLLASVTAGVLGASAG